MEEVAIALLAPAHCFLGRLALGDVDEADQALVGDGAGPGSREKDVDDAAVHAHDLGLLLKGLLAAVARLDGAADGGNARLPVACNRPAHLRRVLGTEQVHRVLVDLFDLQCLRRAR